MGDLGSFDGGGEVVAFVGLFAGEVDRVRVDAPSVVFDCFYGVLGDAASVLDAVSDAFGVVGVAGCLGDLDGGFDVFVMVDGVFLADGWGLLSIFLCKRWDPRDVGAAEACVVVGE